MTTGDTFFSGSFTAAAAAGAALTSAAGATAAGAGARGKSADVSALSTAASMSSCAWYTHKPQASHYPLFTPDLTSLALRLGSSLSVVLCGILQLTSGFRHPYTPILNCDLKGMVQGSPG